MHVYKSAIKYIGRSAHTPRSAKILPLPFDAFLLVFFLWFAFSSYMVILALEAYTQGNFNKVLLLTGFSFFSLILLMRMKIVEIELEKLQKELGYR